MEVFRIGGRRPTGRLDNVDPWSGKNGRKRRKQSGQQAARSVALLTITCSDLLGDHNLRSVGIVLQAGDVEQLINTTGPNMEAKPSSSQQFTTIYPSRVMVRFHSY